MGAVYSLEKGEMGAEDLAALADGSAQKSGMQAGGAPRALVLTFGFPATSSSGGVAAISSGGAPKVETVAKSTGGSLKQKMRGAMLVT